MNSCKNTNFLKSSKTFKLVMWDGGTQFSAVELPPPW